MSLKTKYCEQLITENAKKTYIVGREISKKFFLSLYVYIHVFDTKCLRHLYVFLIAIRKYERRPYIID